MLASVAQSVMHDGGMQGGRTAPAALQPQVAVMLMSPPASTPTESVRMERDNWAPWQIAPTSNEIGVVRL